MNSWRHSDSSTVRTRLLQHRLCLWNAHHPWTRYILFPSLSSVVVSFLSRNGQQISRTTKGRKWNPPLVLLRFVPVVYHRVTSYGTAWYSIKPWSQKKTSRNNYLETALHQSLSKCFFKQERSPNCRLEDCWKSLSTLGTREPVPGYRHKMVLCSQFEYPIWDCVHSYSISPCHETWHELSNEYKLK